jgi:hypothetical protein
MVKQHSAIYHLRNLTTLVALSLIFIGCSDSSLQEAALKSASLVGSVSGNAELLQQSTGNVFALNIEGAKIKPDFKPEQITSVCALAFYNELREDQRNGNCFVKVNIAQMEGEPLQATYTCEELTIADRCIDNLSTYFRWHPSKGLDSIRPAVDPTFFPDSILEFMGQRIPAQDSADYDGIRTEIVGFRPDSVADIPVLVLNTKVVKKEQTQLYDVYARYSSQQLLFVAAKLGKTK